MVGRGLLEVGPGRVEVVCLDLVDRDEGPVVAERLQPASGDETVDAKDLADVRLVVPLVIRLDLVGERTASSTRSIPFAIVNSSLRRNVRLAAPLTDRVGSLEGTSGSPWVADRSA